MRGEEGGEGVRRRKKDEKSTKKEEVKGKTNPDIILVCRGKMKLIRLESPLWGGGPKHQGGQEKFKIGVQKVWKKSREEK